MTAPIIKFQIEKALISSKRSGVALTGPLDGGFWWSEERNAPGRVSFADTIADIRASEVEFKALCDRYSLSY